MSGILTVLRRRYHLTPGLLCLLLFLATFFVVFFFYPLGYVVGKAFVVEGRFTVEFFSALVTDPGRWTVILNSMNLAICVTLGTTAIALPMGVVMARYDFPGKPFFNGLALVPMVLPPFVGAVGMRQMFARFGSVNLFLLDLGVIEEPIDWFGGNSMLGVIILEVLHLYPIMYLNVVSALANIDPSLVEAGQNVGAGRFALFRRILFPLALPGYIAGSSIVFIWAFTDLGTPLIFEYRQVVPVQIFDMLSDLHENPMGYALVVFMVGLTTVFFYLSRSASSGARYEMMSRGHVTERMKPAGRTLTGLTYVGFIGLTAVALIPHCSVVLTSVAERWFMTVIPETFTEEHFRSVFIHPLTTTSIKNSLLLSAFSTFADVILGVGIAYILARTSIPGKAVIDIVAMLPLAVPGIIIAFGYTAAFSGTALDPRVNPFPLLIIAYTVRRIPYMVRAAYAGFQQTSPVLEEAALNAGAGPMQTLRRITVPLISANLVAGGILCFAFAMLEVSDSLILATEERYFPITKAIYSLLGRPDGPFVASALGVLAMVLLMASLFLAGKLLGRRMGELFRV